MPNWPNLSSRAGGRTATAVLAAVLAIGPLAAGCGSTRADSQSPGAGRGQGTPEATESNPGADQSAPASDTEAAIRGSNELATDLFAHLGKDGKNSMISPSSVTSVLAMLTPGARENTLDELTKVLHTKLKPAELAKALGSLDADIQRRAGKETKLSTANSVWRQQGRELNPTFSKLITEAFGGGLREADFKKNPELARKVINDRVAEQTKGKIKGLFPQGTIDKLTRMVLTNAIYLEAKWQQPFPSHATKNRPFKVNGTSKSDVETMYQKDAKVAYGKGNGWQAVEIPYKGDALAMDVVLPDKLDDFKKGLNAAKLSEITGALKTGKSVELTLPKFKFDSSHNLNKPLQSLGLRDAFTEKADFTGLFKEQDDEGPIGIQNAVQKTHVAVDEAGTTAAAATGVSAGIVSAVADPVKFTVDKPFMFMIRDTESGQILFLGQVSNPGN